MKSRLFFESKKQVLILLFGFAFALLTSCSSNPTSTPATPATPVKFQISWLHSIAFVGGYLAQENGYYADENLNVEIMPGGLDEAGNFIDPIERVTSGKADFGVIDSTILLKARADGVPVVAVASIYQRHPLAFTSLRAKNITRPQDLIGATVQVSFNSAVIYQALLAAQDIDPAQVNTVNRTDFTPGPILKGEADVIDAWVITEIAELAAAQQDVNLILPSDYGIEVYPNVIFTTEEMISKNPGVVERFVRATVRGLQNAVDNPKVAAELTFNKYAPERGLEIEQIAMQRAVPLLKPTDSSPGMMKPEVWVTTHEILLEQKILSAPLDIDSAYTLVFLEKVDNQ